MIDPQQYHEVAYNVQTVVDAKHNLPIDYKVTNQNDTQGYERYAAQSKNNFGNKRILQLCMIKDIIPALK